MKKYVYLMLILCIWSAVGCASQRQAPTIEDYGLVEVIGYDQGEQGKIRATIGMRQFAKEAEEESKTYSIEVDLNREILQRVSQESSKTISFTQLRVVLFGEEFAREKGLRDVMLMLYRDASIGDSVLIGVVEGKAEDFINKPNEGGVDTIKVIRKMMEPREQTAFNPFTTIHDFVFHETSAVSDPVVPYLQADEETLRLDRVALFKGDRMIDSISPIEASLMEILAGRKEMSGLMFTQEREGNTEHFLMEFVQVKSRIRSNGDLFSPKVHISVRLKGTVFGYSGTRNLDTAEDLIALQEAANRQVETGIRNLLKKMQDLEIDSIGIGEAFRIYERGPWSKAEWNQALREVAFEIEVDTKISSTGSIR